jgi:hypothetical protein
MIGNDRPALEEPPAAPAADGGRRGGWVRILGLVVVGVIVFGIAMQVGRSRTEQEGGGAAGAVASPAADPAVTRIAGLAELPPGPVEHLELAYFHRTHRCSGCINAERLTRATLDQHFSDRIANGEMSLVVEDTEAPADPGLVAKYDAWGSALYVGVTKGGTVYTWPVDDIWFYVNEDAQFISVLFQLIRDIYSAA